MLFPTVGLAALTTAAFAATTRSSCNDYVLISTRGTGEDQGPSIGFKTMISDTLDQLPNGMEYDTVYPAGDDQNTTLAVQDMIKTIDNGLESCPDQVYALLGYSQGATAVLDTLNSDKLSDEARGVIDAVILIGNPYRLPTQESNVEGMGADDAVGEANILSHKPIPESFDKSGKVLDFCYTDDCVCKDACTGDKEGHLRYGSDETLQEKAAKYLVKYLS